jgi:hypothetical protein
VQNGSDGFGVIFGQYDARIADLSARLDATARGMEAIVERLERVEAGQTAITAGRGQAA